MNKKGFWITLSLFNLGITAFLGLLLRSKILFAIPSINYKYLLSGHSHFAFGGWAALALVTLMVHDLLSAGDKRIYQWILWGLQLTSLGMVFTFPFTGYATFSIIFSTLHILVNYLFAYAFIKDVRKRVKEKSTRLLGITSVICLVLSSIGPFALAYLMATKQGNANLQRDLIYTFLHFQYNGFFIVAALSLYVHRLQSVQLQLNPLVRKFSVALCLSIVPTLFLSLLWHNYFSFFLIAIIGCVLVLIGVFLFGKLLCSTWKKGPFTNALARSLFILSFLSLGLKMILQIGPIFPSLGNSVYGDRPLIIGFLHLVFLGFLTLYLLASFVEDGYFTRTGKTTRIPFFIFTFGVIINETLLMIQGLGILFFFNTSIYNPLLWINSMVMMIGAFMLAFISARKLKGDKDQLLH